MLEPKRVDVSSGLDDLVEQSKDELFAALRYIKITPALATEMLSRNTKNRKMSLGHVARLAMAMRSGQWQANNGQAISISRDGELLDGQHRLSAVIKAGTAIAMPVFVGVDSESFTTIDLGKKRLASDTAFIDDIQYHHEVTQALGMVKRLTGDNLNAPQTQLTPQEFRLLYTEHPNITDFVQHGKEAHKERMGPVSVHTALAYLFSRVNEKKADEFYEILNNGLLQDKKCPIYHLKVRLMGRRMSRGTCNKEFRRQVAVLTVTAWNHFRAGKKVGNLILRKNVKTLDWGQK